MAKAPAIRSRFRGTHDDGLLFGARVVEERSTSALHGRQIFDLGRAALDRQEVDVEVKVRVRAFRRALT